MTGPIRALIDAVRHRAAGMGRTGCLVCDAPRCPACGRLKASATTCDPALRPGVSRYTVDDLPFDPEEPDWAEVLPRRCRSCGVRHGGVHHVHCTIAACLEHDHDQRTACGCDGDGPDEDEGEIAVVTV